MAVNIEAIRKKMAQLSGTPKFWKPEVGEYRIRVVPWREDELQEGCPFPELQFYNLGEKKNWVQICAPAQFGKPDPIADVLTELWQGDEADKEIAKKLRPSSSTYVAFVDRAKTEKGTQVWRLPGGKTGQNIHQKLLSFFMDAEVLEDVDDWTDPQKGFDLKIVVKDSGKRFNDRPVLDFDVSIAKRPNKLSDDPEQIKKWLADRPTVKDYYTLESPEAIQAKLDKWLASGTSPSTDTSDGTSRGGDKSAGDKLDEIANDVKSAMKNVDREPSKAGATSDLDAALADLDKDDE